MAWRYGKFFWERGHRPLNIAPLERTTANCKLLTDGSRLRAAGYWSANRRLCYAVPHSWLQGGPVPVPRCRPVRRLVPRRRRQDVASFGWVWGCSSLHCLVLPTYNSRDTCESSPCLIGKITSNIEKRYTFDVGRDVEKATEDVKAYMSGKREGEPDDIARVQTRIAAQEQMQIPKASWSDFIRHYSIRKNALLLFGTAGSWFLLDVACKLYISEANDINHSLNKPTQSTESPSTMRLSSRPSVIRPAAPTLPTTSSIRRRSVTSSSFSPELCQATGCPSLPSTRWVGRPFRWVGSSS